MVTVWAYQEKDFDFESKIPGFDYVYGFKNLSDLVQRLNKLRIGESQIKKISIVAHGRDGGGVVYPEGRDDDRILSIDTIGTFAEEFKGLNQYLWVLARVIFSSCVAGAGQKGSAFLNALSGSYLRGKHVIGYEKHGTYNAPGNIGLHCSTSRPVYTPCEPAASGKPVEEDHEHMAEQVMNEYSIYSKWSYRGEIIKIPHSERTKKRKLKPKMIYGIRAVEQAIMSMKEGGAINHIYMAKEQPRPADLKRLRDICLKNGFLDQPPAGKLDYRSQAELSKLVGPGKPHQGVVAEYHQVIIPNQQWCVFGGCPGHGNDIDVCIEPLWEIPNGPLY